MKKLLLLFMVAFMICIIRVDAITEDELYTKLTQEYTVNGATFKATDTQKNLIKTYLKQYEVNSTDADYIVTKLEEVFNVLKTSGKTSFYNLSAKDKKKIVDLVAEVAANTSVDVAIVDGELKVYVPGTNKGEVFYETPVNPITTGEMAQTNRTLIMASLGIFTVIGMALAFRKIRNA